MGRKRNRESSMKIGHRHIFPILLAASTRIDTLDCRRLIVKCLKMHLHFVGTHQRNPDSVTLQQILPNALLVLLPLLLHTKYKNILSLGAEIVGAISLSSFAASIKLVSDANVLHGLLYMLSRDNHTTVAAQNAIMDLATTPVGLEQLKESSALDKLLSLFCQCGSSLGETDSSLNQKKSCNGIIMETLDALVTLINASDIERLMRIPHELCTSSLFTMKQLWCNLQSSMKSRKLRESSEKGCEHDQRLCHLAGAIFRLSMIQDHGTCVIDVVKRSLFGDGGSWFHYFILNHWENSAVLVKQSSKALKDDDNIIFSLFNCVDSRNIDALLDYVLNRLVSCPPIVSDELNILHILEDIKGELGHPMRYGQDIRLLKTLKEGNAKSDIGNAQREVHYFSEWTSYRKTESSEFFDTVNIEDCKNAYYKGYTISLRGIEFRSKKIAAIAHSLGSIFGQLSAGANLYITPPQAQGLARHCDDHCVFVCQLVGRKQWTVFPRKIALLPRLYEQSSPQCFDYGSETCEGEEFLLTEGDILYIPRGCLHEAHTISKDDGNYMDMSSEFSLHLTLSVEVEPPFEWEGFAHVALYTQTRACKGTENHLLGRSCAGIHLMSVNLLHVSIRLVARTQILFQKACMVGTLGSKYGTDDQILPANIDHKAYFSRIMNIINGNCNFYETFATVKAAVGEKNSQLLESMHWLRNLQSEEEVTVETDWSIPLEIFKRLAQLDKSQISELEREFSKVKFYFCEKIVFDDVCEMYGMLLVRYMNVRKYYINGMLSLHNSA